MLNEAECAGVRAGVVRGFATVGIACAYVPLPAIALRYVHRAVEMGEQVGDPIALGQAHLATAIVLNAAGEWDDAYEHFRRSQDINWRAGDLRSWGGAGHYMSYMRTMRPEYAAGAEIAAEMTRVGEEGGDVQLRGWGTQEWGTALAREGRIDEALPLLESALSLSTRAHDFIGIGKSSADLARCYRAQGRLQDAIRVAEDGNRPFDTYGLVSGGATTTRIGLAESYLAAAEAVAGAERRSLLGKAKGACTAALRLGKIHHEAVISGSRVRATHETGLIQQEIARAS